MVQSRARPPPDGRPSRAAVFLDRDGTLVEEVPYLHDPELVALLPGVAGALARLAAAGYALVLVTNQAGVARGFYDEAAVDRVHQRLGELLAGAGVKLDGIHYCPHHPEGTVAAYARPCRCRKPGPGMLERAAERLNLDLAASYLIGNHPTDLGAAIAAGATPLFVTTGAAATLPLPWGPPTVGCSPPFRDMLPDAFPGTFPDAPDVFPDLEAAAAAVLNRPHRSPTP
jgi:D-glycero-D-manno-heptose 1,7-bisphosphate phosphatase